MRGALNGNVLVIATRNQGKVREFAHRFGKLGLTVKSLADYEALPDIVEDRDTFAGNAEKKAVVIAQALGLPVLADDSGLCVDALDGAPGVYSARYAGEPSDDAANNRKLLRELQQLRPTPAAALEPPAPEPAPDGARALSTARFVCALAVHDPETGATLHAEGACEGWILDRALGDNGFGYDPLFLVPAYGRTMAQLSIEEKNAISHRAVAIDRLLELWRDQ
ncbi:non-canonical purine NTP pyrophosphatase [Paenibacillus sp. HJGM_3]|uniref:non-canonical purine NTP pyrophosphatase n=1 Tax=Paenibacillus sp. HJGM_3 TaxID=3379816 RepID=UPI00385BF886